MEPSLPLLKRAALLCRLRASSTNGGELKAATLMGDAAVVMTRGPAGSESKKEISGCEMS